MKLAECGTAKPCGSDNVINRTKRFHPTCPFILRRDTMSGKKRLYSGGPCNDCHRIDVSPRTRGGSSRIEFLHSFLVKPISARCTIEGTLNRRRRGQRFTLMPPSPTVFISVAYSRILSQKIRWQKRRKERLKGRDDARKARGRRRGNGVVRFFNVAPDENRFTRAELPSTNPMAVVRQPKLAERPRLNQFQRVWFR